MSDDITSKGQAASHTLLMQTFDMAAPLSTEQRAALKDLLTYLRVLEEKAWRSEREGRASIINASH